MAKSLTMINSFSYVKFNWQCNYEFKYKDIRCLNIYPVIIIKMCSIEIIIIKCKIWTGSYLWKYIELENKNVILLTGIPPSWPIINGYQILHSNIEY